MYLRIIVYLSENEWKILERLAEQDIRGMREQARFLLSRELNRLNIARLVGRSVKPRAIEGAFHNDNRS